MSRVLKMFIPIDSIISLLENYSKKCPEIQKEKKEILSMLLFLRVKNYPTLGMGVYLNIHIMDYFWSLK
jgi:hypothetical protein